MIMPRCMTRANGSAAPPHDAFFKAVFENPEHASAMARHVLSNLDKSAIDWRSIESSSATFVDPELERNYTDLLFSVNIAGKQGHRRRSSNKHLPVILTIVVSNAEFGWNGPLSLRDQYQPHPSSIAGLDSLLPQFRLVLLDLSKVSNDELKNWALAAFPKAALFALRDIHDDQKILQNFEHWAPYAAAAAQTPCGVEALRQLMRYITQSSPDLNIEDFRAKIRQHLPRAENELMSIYEQALQKGQQQGREQGRQDSLRQLLTLKFGELPPQYATRLQAARPEELDRYFERFLAADTLPAIFDEPA